MGRENRASKNPPISRDRPSVPPPSSDWTSPLFQQVSAALCELNLRELADVARLIQRLKAARGAASDPDLISRVVVEVVRVFPEHKHGLGVPIAHLRAELKNVPRPTLDFALRDAEDGGFLRLVPVPSEPSRFEKSNGITSPKGLLCYAVPS